MNSYGQLSTLFYDWDKPHAPEIALAWFASRLNGRVLEPMCGSGRFMIPLLESGMKVDGVDTSIEMLDACRKRIAGHEECANVYQQSLQELDLAFREYESAFIPASSFCLISDREQALGALIRLHEHLTNDAAVLIEFEPPMDFAPEYAEPARVITKGRQQIRLTIQRSYNATEGLETYQNVYELKESGRVIATEEETLTLRCYTDEQMVELLSQAGFLNATIEKPEFGSVATAHR
ncbi:class I SAM-dependent methyltransferase [Planctomycetota bacterium]|nr:class I SAM-dependent methyltransferase [Planctomycetota bacterium]